jgi:hypothetical protein
MCQATGSLSAKFSSGEVPQQFATAMTMFIDEYADSNLQANQPAESFKDNVFTFLKTVQVALKEPYQFQPFHQAIRAPFDYYRWYVTSCSVHKVTDFHYLPKKLSGLE